MTGKTSSRLALLVDGPWGTGKTHLIREIIESSELKAFRVHYVTLFGLASPDDLHARISAAALAKGRVSEKSLGKADGILKKIGELGGDYKIPSIVINSLLSLYEIPENTVIVLDDLERANIDSSSLFGIINHWIEHNSCRVVLVGCLDKMETGNLAGLDRHYSKIIGERIAYEGNVKEILEDYVNRMMNDSSTEMLQAMSQVIPSILRCATADVRSAIHIFDRTYDLLERILSANILEDSPVQVETVALFGLFAASFSIALRVGEISVQEMNEFDGFEMREILERMQNGVEMAESIQRRFLNQYDLRIGQMPVNIGSMIDVCTAAALDTEKLIKELIEKSRPSAIDTKEWMRLWYFLRLETEEEFDSLFSEVLQQWESRTFTEAHELLHVYCVLVGISRIRRETERAKDLLADLEKYLAATPIHTSSGRIWMDQDAAFGLGYFLKRSDSDREPAEKLIHSAILEALKNQNRTIASAWVGSLADDPEKAFEIIDASAYRDSEELLQSFDSELNAVALTQVLVDLVGASTESAVTRLSHRYATVREKKTVTGGINLFEAIVAESMRLIAEAESNKKWLLAHRVGALQIAAERVVASLKIKLRQLDPE